MTHTRCSIKIYRWVHGFSKMSTSPFSSLMTPLCPKGKVFQSLPWSGLCIALVTSWPCPFPPHTHTLRHTCNYTDTHRYTNTWSWNTQTYPWTYADPHRCTYTNMHTCTHTWTHIHTNTNVSIDINRHIRRTHIHRDTHRYTHTQTHTNRHRKTHGWHMDMQIHR